MKLLIKPHLEELEGNLTSGINQVIAAQFKYLPAHGIELVGPREDFDIMMVHAAMTDRLEKEKPLVAFCHGLYWTGDYDAPPAEYLSNANIIQSIRWANETIVPSRWVAEAFQRDMRFTPDVIGHGVDFETWASDTVMGEYALWNKNRTADVCSPVPMNHLANTFMDRAFVSTFSTYQQPPNLRVTGIVPHIEMIRMIKQCGLYLSTTKETFGIGTLEAMAAGKPILGFAEGGNLDLVQHGVNGYLARPEDFDDLAQGYEWCMAHQEKLGKNSQEIARQFTWERSIEKLAGTIRRAILPQDYGVTVVIPVFNKSKTLGKAIDSVLNQTLLPEQIIIVNDGSDDDSLKLARKWARDHKLIKVIDQPNSGVAVARNRGIDAATTPYITCLDADDWIKPEFLEKCVKRFKLDRTLGLVYTRLETYDKDGMPYHDEWPPEMDFDRQIDYTSRMNHVPTCNVFKKEAWARAGGFRARYAPAGAGSEDAALWTAMGAMGYGFERVNEYLFCYTAWQGHTSDKDYQEPDWLGWYPWAQDGMHPLASQASPEMFSHKVYQHDDPDISVVIPVGPGHEHNVIEALDSLEAQSFRKWEVVLAWDSREAIPSRLTKAFPYARIVRTRGEEGAGVARNRGVEHSRGKYILYLDADDVLNPSAPLAMKTMLELSRQTKTAIYSDYIGRRFIKPEDLSSDERRDLLRHDSDNEAWFAGQNPDFDCHKATGPIGANQEIYIWNLISTLFPKIWHNEIGGFDETMPTWEDWDYWVRMAKAGHCFTRIAEPYFVYKFYSGQRRQIGIDNWEKTLEFMALKHQKIGATDMGCGCGGRQQTGGVELMAEDMVLIEYMHANMGQHLVVGPSTRTDYGRHAGSRGEQFPVHQADINAAPNLFVVVKRVDEVAPLPEAPAAPPEAPLELDMVAPPTWVTPVTDLDIDDLPITPMAKKSIRESGVDVTKLDEFELVKIDGIAKKSALKILDYLKEKSLA